MTALAARTGPGDPMDDVPDRGSDVVAFSSPRRTLWGVGVADRIEVPAPWPEHLGVVAERLASISYDGPPAPGHGPVAFGALPYDRDAPARLVVPAAIHGRTAEGERWTTRIGGPDDDGCVLRTDRSTRRPPSTVTVRGADPQRWMDAVEEATRRIRDGELTKVVLAREITVTGDEAFDATTLWKRLSVAAPTSFAYCIDGFVGATPELLVSRIGHVVRAHPMAGTTPRTGDPDVDARRAGELLGSSKNRTEHQITIDMVHDTLLPWCSYLDAEPEPSVVAAGPVQHLATLVEGRLSMPEPSVLELVAALHPTPAVGGWPRDAALEIQARLEGADRGRYAGPVGWVDAAGSGVFGVGIRGVELAERSARMFVGVGVVAESDPLAELEETRAKAQAVLGALTRI